MTHPVEEMRTPPPRQRRRHPIVRRIVLISLALLVALVTIFAIVYQRAVAQLDEHLKAEYAVTGYAAVSFSPRTISTMSYDDIVTFMSAYGMMLDDSICAPYDIFEPQPHDQETYLSGNNPVLYLYTTIQQSSRRLIGKRSFAHCQSWKALILGSCVMELPSIIKSGPGLDGGMG
jgi:hypothetical protein